MNNHGRMSANEVTAPVIAPGTFLLRYWFTNGMIARLIFFFSLFDIQAIGTRAEKIETLKSYVI